MLYYFEYYFRHYNILIKIPIDTSLTLNFVNFCLFLSSLIYSIIISRIVYLNVEIKKINISYKHDDFGFAKRKRQNFYFIEQLYSIFTGLINYHQ